MAAPSFCEDSMYQAIVNVSTLSALSLFLIAIYLMFRKKLNQHPYQLIGITCLAESLFFSLAMPITTTKCATVFWLKIKFIQNLLPYFDNSKNIAVFWFRTINFEVELGEYLSLILNCCLFFDLLLTIINPFG